LIESSIPSGEDRGEDRGEDSALKRSAWPRVLLSALAWASVGIYFAAATVILGLRYWLLPNVEDYAGAVEQALSQTMGERVTIGGIRAGWHGLRPELDLTDLRIHDREGRMVLSLPGVNATVSWTSLAYASIHFHSLAFEQPNLEIRRDSAGRLFIAGMELKDNQSGPDVSAWLLSQREIVIRNASLSWEDERRAAPRLEFSGVTLALRNAGELHRFAVRARAHTRTDGALASALDVRGELRGGSIEQIQDWTGRLFAELDYTDLAVWQRWFDYPLEIRSGKGGVRLWLGFSGKQLTEATADVALAKVSARLGRELPLLDLDYLEGRLGGKHVRDGFGDGFEVFGKKLSLKTGGGVALPPADFGVRWRPGSAARPPSGELQANALELQPLAHLGEFLPFPQELRRQLAEIDPRGSVFDLKLTWAGAAEGDRPEHYSARGRFANLGARAWHRVPGFSGLSGQLDGNEKGGNLSLGAKNAAVELPGILPDEKVHFDTLTAQVGWVQGKDGLELKFSNVALANRDIAGTMFGTFATKPDSPGMIDLTGSFSRLDGASTYRYIPRLPEPVRNYLKSGVQAGHAYDISLRLKGDLAHFPFDDPKQGSFQVVGKVSGADFNYADGWPGLTGLSGELVFEGRQMRIFAPKGTVFGVRIVNAKATIADLFNRDEVLNVDGQAEGPTSDFLRFVDSSPVTRFIDGFTEGMRATGNGRLQLKLELPIRRLQQAKVAGSLQLTGNQIAIDPDFPALSFAQVNGRLDFTESGISARNLASQFLGGPTVISVATLADGTVSVSAQGTATAAAARRLVDLPLLDQASGSALWRGSISIKRRVFELLVESSLQGVALKLPPPLGKTAGEALAMRIARTNSVQSESLRRFQVERLPPRGDAIMLSVGHTLNGVIVRAREGERMVVERGALGLNERTPALERPGIVVAGSLPYLDLDHWRTLLGAGEGAGSATPATPLTALNLRLGALDFAGRRINELSVRATRSAGLWNANLSARELAGDITWRPEGQGRIVARLRHLTIPEPAPDAAQEDAQSHSQSQGRELPALDISADNFVAGATKFGRLELVAVNQARDWRIERLVLSNPESTLTADGYWQSWAARPSTSMNVKLDVTDAGKYLERLGYPGTLRGGSAHLEGKLGWAGSPQGIDYPTLTGNVSLKVEKGQFLKADPGAAKLLGILSLQSLLTFDLRDLFSEGFAFDAISSGAQIARGVLTTRDFDMRGAAARVGMTGEIDLARETQKLRLRVVPSLGDSATTAATLLLKINPVTGLGALIAQRIFKDPLGQIFSFEYSVTGSWSEPRVERVQGEARESAVQ
jgi:uncharacterized protein (TIGR02099 family)